MNDKFNENDTMKYIKSYMFIKGYAVAKKLDQTLIALSVARRLHEGQYRKDGLLLQELLPAVYECVQYFEK